MKELIPQIEELEKKLNEISRKPLSDNAKSVYGYLLALEYSSERLRIKIESKSR